MKQKEIILLLAPLFHYVEVVLCFFNFFRCGIDCEGHSVGSAKADNKGGEEGNDDQARGEANFVMREKLLCVVTRM